MIYPYKIISVLISLIIISSCLGIYAECDDINTSDTARNITADCQITSSHQISLTELTDDKYTTFAEVPQNTSFAVSAGENIGGIYLKFYSGSVEWELYTEDNKCETYGKMGYLHEYVPVENTNTVTLKFPVGTSLSEITVYSKGKLPDDVQIWTPPCEKADLMLLSTHSDDEHLFFAGVIPWTLSKGAQLQVVYMTNHKDIPSRLHEQLNGLWAVGVRNYPEIGPFPDLYSTSLEQAKNVFGNYGCKWDDFVKFQVDMIRKYKPQVIVGHDVNGEYSHGAHMLNTATLFEALELCGSGEAYPESAQNYGTWDVKKTYIHLYDQNKLVIDIDSPLDCYGGKTAYQVSCDGYGYHYSQHWTWFTEWLLGPDKNGYESAAQISSYHPAHYGLYKTIVGNDMSGNDFFENITLYKDIAPPDTEPVTIIEPYSSEYGNHDNINEHSKENPGYPVPKSHNTTMYIILGILFVMIFIIVIIMIMNIRPRKRRKRKRTKKAPQIHNTLYSGQRPHSLNQNSNTGKNQSMYKNATASRPSQLPPDIRKRK